VHPAAAPVAIGLAGAAATVGLIVGTRGAESDAFAESVTDYGYGLADRSAPWYQRWTTCCRT